MFRSCSKYGFIIFGIKINVGYVILIHSFISYCSFCLCFSIVNFKSLDAFAISLSSRTLAINQAQIGRKIN